MFIHMYGCPTISQAAAQGSKGVSVAFPNTDIGGAKPPCQNRPYIATEAKSDISSSHLLCNY